jgi:hypothetical protein
MQKIIALRGKGNSGKSTTIRILHDLLLQNEFRQVSSNLKAEGGDFIAIFSKNEKYIGITSSGDTYDLVHQHLLELVNAKCDICICTCRTFDRIPPGTSTAILEFTNLDNLFIEKTIDNYEATQSATNERDAQNLLLVLNVII